MLTLTQEQELICQIVTRGDNIVVDAVAGSGKTWTILEMIARNPNLKFFVLLYSASLKAETRSRFLELNSHNNAYIHSFHSAIHQIAPPCHNDEHLLAFLETNTDVHVPDFDVMVIDECQDLTPLLLQVITRLCRCQKSKPQMVVIGDRYQCIYQYNGADSRFLTLAHKVFRDVAKPAEWVPLGLSMTFRSPKSHVQFVNECVLATNRLNVPATAPVGQIAYHAVDSFNAMPGFVTKAVLDRLDAGANVTEIAILVAGVNIGLRHPLRRLVNELAKNNIDIYMRNSNGYTSAEQMRNKLCILSFHQSKGLEFKHVILLGFDESYRTFYDRGLTPTGSVPNTIYVALTRARASLTMLRDVGQLPFDFLTGTLDTCSRAIPAAPKKWEQPGPKSVTDVCRYLSVYTLNRLMSQITVTQIEAPFVDVSDHIMLPDTVTTSRDLVEFVADLNGTIVHQLWQSDLTIAQITDEIVNNFFETALEDEARMSKMCYRKRQLADVQWPSADLVRRLVRRAREIFDYDCERIVYEAPTFLEMDEVKIHGSIDGYRIDTDAVYELTTAMTIQAEKVLQTALYTVSRVKIVEYDAEAIPNFGMIYNACTGQLLHVHVDDPTLFMQAMADAMQFKYDVKADDEFLAVFT